SGQPRRRRGDGAAQPLLLGRRRAGQGGPRGRALCVSVAAEDCGEVFVAVSRGCPASRKGEKEDRPFPDATHRRIASIFYRPRSIFYPPQPILDPPPPSFDSAPAGLRSGRTE